LAAIFTKATFGMIVLRSTLLGLLKMQFSPKDRENCSFTNPNNVLRKISIPNVAFVKIAAKTFASYFLYHFSTFSIFHFISPKSAN